MELLILFLIFGFAIVVLFWLSDRPNNHDAIKKRDVVGPHKRSSTNVPAPVPSPTYPKAHQPKVDHAPPPPIPVSRELHGRAYVIDGDTIVVSKIKVRLAGIDAPELDRPWGQKSKWEMVKICKGHVIHVKLTGETSYDRLVGTCYLPDGTDVGAEIIKAGLALDGGYYSKGKYRHLEPEGIRRRLKPYGNQIRS